MIFHLLQQLIAEFIKIDSWDPVFAARTEEGLVQLTLGNITIVQGDSENDDAKVCEKLWLKRFRHVLRKSVSNVF
jgi:hypothetical protein